MGEYDNFSVKVKNLRCFGDQESGFDGIKPINLIIGKNNSGKSTLLDAINNLCSNPVDIKDLGYKRNTIPEISFEKKLTESDLRKVFHSDRSGGTIEVNHWEFGRAWIDKPIKWKITNGKREFISIEPKFNRQRMQEYEEGLVASVSIPFKTKAFKRLQPDRNLKAETHSDQSIDSHGNQATNYISKYLVSSNLPEDLIKKTILGELNKIFEPDTKFIGIQTKQHKDNTWEIYLSEFNKGNIALSQSGSGLKTILLVLIYLYLIPHVEKTNLSNYVFGFEELENNLHPSLQRRLFTYLKDIAIKDGCIFFLTTHSNIIIDLFSKNEDCQIIHVKHDGEKAVATRAITYSHHKNILDDLEVRASDLLQSNCIIWLEGPTDRLYFNKWIELFTNGDLQEGVHYQCVFYGGKLLAQLTSEDPSLDESELMNILNVNKNAILLLDSDKKVEADNINKTKQRVIKEVREMGGLDWVTTGKEIENYLPAEAIRSSILEENSLNQIGKYEKFSDYLNKYKAKEGEKFLKDKMSYAERFIPFLTKENLKSILDLEEKITLCIDKIKEWNGIEL